MKNENAKLAAITILGICIFVSIMFVAFPFIQPELDPMKRFGSEYVVGRHGWLMRVAFYSFATGIAAFVFAIGKTFDSAIRSRLVMGLFSVGAVGIVFSGVFDTELLIPNSTPPPEWTESTILPWTHHAHKAAGITAFLSMVPAIGLMTRRLRKAGRLSGYFVILRVLAWLLPIAFVVFAAWSIEAGYAGFGQRLFLSLYFCWMLIASYGILTGAFARDANCSEPLA